MRECSQRQRHFLYRFGFWYIYLKFSSLLPCPLDLIERTGWFTWRIEGHFIEFHGMKWRLVFHTIYNTLVLGWYGKSNIIPISTLEKSIFFVGHRRSWLFSARRFLLALMKVFYIKNGTSLLDTLMKVQSQRILMIWMF